MMSMIRHRAATSRTRIKSTDRTISTNGELNEVSKKKFARFRFRRFSPDGLEKHDGSKHENTADLLVSGLTVRNLWNLVGLVVLVYVGYRSALYMAQLLEKNSYFSHIKDIEREISFRTEAGLYYSYYKHLVQSPSFISGISGLINDNVTEHPTSINVLARMNIYQEVLLAAVYRTFWPLQTWLDPIYFYIDTVFALQMLLVCSLFLMTWIMSGTWVAGLLASLFYVFNRFDTTRVESYMALRENFSLPFLWAQLASITIYSCPQSTPTQQNFAKKLIPIWTFLFAVTWQFNQFALLLQALALFVVQLLRFVELDKILHIYKSHLISMFLVWILQFFNVMIPTGLHVSFVLSAVIILKLQGLVIINSSFLIRVFCLFFYGALMIFLTITVNKTLSFIIKHEADEHIKRFVMAKFGFSYARDFDVRLYLCNGAFGFIVWDVFERLTKTLLFPFYLPVHFCLIILILVSAWNTLCRNVKDSGDDKNEIKKPEQSYLLPPHIAFHAVQTVSFGAVAVVAVRMKYFWTPYMGILAAVGLSHPAVWRRVILLFNKSSSADSKVKSSNNKEKCIGVLRHAALMLVMLYLLVTVLPEIVKDLNHETEFFDPDTVELMNWIKSNTPVGAAFSGSMQLMAGVKLCTGRPITNHPHYEDKHLREKTKQLYQMYGRSNAEEVYSILVRYQSDYIILEDSICMAQSRPDQCGLPDIMDIENHLVFDEHIPVEYQEPLRKDRPARFCDEIRYERNKDFVRLFRLVFSNKTFRIYKVL